VLKQAQTVNEKIWTKKPCHGMLFVVHNKKDMLPVIAIIAIIVVILFVVFAAKKKNKGESLGDRNAGTGSR
jgi:uncharacterized integral membrane protein